MFLSSLTPTKFSFYKSQIKSVMIYTKSHLADDWLLRLGNLTFSRKETKEVYIAYTVLFPAFLKVVCVRSFLAAILPQCHLHSCLVFRRARKKLSTLGHSGCLCLLGNIIVLSSPFLQVSLPVLDDFPRINSYKQRYWGKENGHCQKSLYTVGILCDLSQEDLSWLFPRSPSPLDTTQHSHF